MVGKPIVPSLLPDATAFTDQDFLIGVDGEAAAGLKTKKFSKAVLLSLVNEANDDRYATKSLTEAALAEKVPATRTVNGHDLSEDVTLSKDDVGLDNVDNTSDLDKPVSDAVQTALDLKVNAVDALIAHPGTRAGAYYYPMTCQPGAASVILAQDAMYFLPFFMPGAEVRRMGVEITTPTDFPEDVWLGLYTNVDGMPGELLLDAGLISTDVEGLAEVVFSPTSLPNAFVWAAIHSNSGSVALRSGTAINTGWILGAETPNAGTAKGLLSNVSFGSLPYTPPDTFTAPVLASQVPNVYLKR